MYSSESFDDSSPLDALIVIWSQDVEKVIFNTLFRLSSLTCLIVVWDGGAFFSQCVIQWHAFLLRLSDNWFSLLQCLWIVFYNKVVDFCNKVIYSYISTLFKTLSTAWNFVGICITLALQEVLKLGGSVALHLWTLWLFFKQTSTQELPWPHICARWIGSWPPTPSIACTFFQRKFRSKLWVHMGEWASCLVLDS